MLGKVTRVGVSEGSSRNMRFDKCVYHIFNLVHVKVRRKFLTALGDLS